jgi:hypothetical protein
MLFGLLVAELEKLWPAEAKRWRGLRLVACDKTTLQLPESPALWKKYGHHDIRTHLGPVAVEFCCFMTVLARAPFAFTIAPADTSEDRMLKRMKGHLRKNDLLLIDNGFYAAANFRWILAQGAHFLIPANTTVRPRLLKELGASDYLAEIIDSHTKEAMTVRVVYVQRNGFRRRRLVTSLLDPIAFPASELSGIYHRRWTIETFYDEFKNDMSGNRWHCKTVENFRKELACKLILVCLTRLAIAKAAKKRRTTPGMISFSKACAETRRFILRVMDSSAPRDFETGYGLLVAYCARHKITVRPGRSFTRDKQERRRKARGLVKGKVGRPRKPAPKIKRADRRFATDSTGNTYLLS